MKVSKAIKAAAVIGLIVLPLTGCAQNGASSSTGANMKTVTDVYGRTVEVPENVESCATVGSAARFVVYAGGQDKLVAVTEMDTPASASRPYTVACEDVLVKLPTTSNGNHLMETSVNGEALLEVDPDVIISSRSKQECDDLQSQLNIPVVGISYQDQIFSDNVFESIEVVGQTLDTESHAQGVIDKMMEWQTDLEDRTADIPEEAKPTCYAGAVNYKGAKSFGGTYAKYPPFEAVNIKNVADDATDKGSIDVSLEQLGEWNPDFMFLNAGNMNLMEKDYTDNKPFFDSLTAFQSGNLFSQPSYNMNGTNVELAICDAYFDGAVVYPFAFQDVDLEAKFKEIFRTMLGSNYYDQMKSLGMDFTRLSFN